MRVILSALPPVAHRLVQSLGGCYASRAQVVHLVTTGYYLPEKSPGTSDEYEYEYENECK